MMTARIVKILVLSLSTAIIFATGLPGFAADGENWTYWRGPQSHGVAAGDAPLNWDDTNNVRWKIEIPGRGNSSPIIWGEKIFVTTAVPTGSAPPKAPAPKAAPAKKAGRGFNPMGNQGPPAEHTFEIHCYDRNTGKLLWKKTARTAVPHEGFHGQYGSFASNSPVTDGKYVYAFFGSRGIYCYDLEGNLIWEKDFGVPMKMRMAFGEGIAPVVSGDRLILVFDHEGDSFIAVLDKNSGEEIWRLDREEGSNWAAPLVVDYKGQKQIIVNGTNKVRCYDFETGKLIWECGGLGANPIPQPVAQGDMVFVMTGYRDPNLMAIKLGGSGDLTGTDAIVWSQTRGNSYTASPVLHDNKLYVLTDNGMISCYNATTGEPYYHQQRLPQTYSFNASPVAAGGKLYLASENEDVVVLKLGEEFEVLATNTMTDQMFVASPAISRGEIFLRSQKYLYCIGDE
ncbi:MAG: PQQ-like beta-propeller repeat protein [Acidobacteriota bacterium]